MTGGQLFPHFVCRVAGVPAGGLEELAAVESVACCHALRELEAELGQLRGPLSEALFEAVGGLENQELRRDLLRLKRDVHNLRPLDRSVLERVRQATSPSGAPHSLIPDLERYDRLTASLRQAEARFESCFEAELVRIRRRFQQAAGDEDFRNGVLLASMTLFDEIERYTRADARHPGAKARQVERSLLRYYTRTAVKTTPFSTFCAIVPGRLHDDPSRGAAGFFGNPREKSTVLRLNKAMYPFLVQALTARPAIRRHLSVELNPTLRRMDGRWFFLTGIGRREVFQQLAPNPVLGLLLDILGERGRLPLAALTETLLEEVEASEDKITAYLDRLLDAGFLRFRLGIREQDLDWDRCLCRLLEGVEDDLARRTVRFLQEYRRLAGAYAEAALERRRSLLERVTALVDRYFENVRETEGWAPGTETLFEDAGGNARLVLGLGDLGDLLAEYVRLTRPFIWILGEQANMRHFFSEHYSEPVPLLRFYEDYYREHLQDRLERQEQVWTQTPGEADEERERAFAHLANPFQLELVAKLNAARQGLGKRIRELWRAAPSAEEIVLERRDLEELTAGLPDLEDPFRSVSLFVQPVPGIVPGDREGRDGLVLDEVLVGFGKYFSRFLYLLPDEVEKDLVASNRRLTRGELAEICGDASFNADLHPPLLPREIAYPTAEGGSAREQIAVSDLMVEPDPERPFRVRLVNAATGQEVVPVDLGFRNPQMRPLLFQMLSRMTPASAFELHTPSRPEEPGHAGREAPGHVIHRPRLTYRGRLVLARRRWTLPQALFPARGRQESEAGYFLRIRRWREELDLPEEVFVRIANPGGERRVLPDTGWPGQSLPGKNPPGKKPGLRDHLGKAQYIDFRNPLLVDLFSRMTENLETYEVILEERLPGRDQLIPSGEDRFVTEMILQVDFPEEA